MIIYTHPILLEQSLSPKPLIMKVIYEKPDSQFTASQITSNCNNLHQIQKKRRPTKGRRTKTVSLRMTAFNKESSHLNIINRARVNQSQQIYPNLLQFRPRIGETTPNCVHICENMSSDALRNDECPSGITPPNHPYSYQLPDSRQWLS